MLLLEPLAHVYGNRGFASGQVRIAFSRGNENLVNEVGDEIGGKTLYGGVVLTRGDALRELSLLPFETLSGFFGDDFHIFSMTWTSTSMTFAVDGLPYAVIDSGFHEIYKKHVPYAASWQNGNKMAPFDQLVCNYLNLTLSFNNLLFSFILLLEYRPAVIPISLTTLKLDLKHHELKNPG